MTDCGNREHRKCIPRFTDDQCPFRTPIIVHSHRPISGHPRLQTERLQSLHLSFGQNEVGHAGIRELASSERANSVTLPPASLRQTQRIYLVLVFDLLPSRLEIVMIPLAMTLSHVHYSNGWSPVMGWAAG